MCRDVGGIGALTQEALAELQSARRTIIKQRLYTEPEPSYLALTAVRTLLMGAQRITARGASVRVSGARRMSLSNEVGYASRAGRTSLGGRSLDVVVPDLSEFERAGGVPMLEAALQCEHSQGTVEHALAIIGAAVACPTTRQGESPGGTSRIFNIMW